MKRDLKHLLPLGFLLIVGLLMVAATIKHANDTAPPPNPRIKYMD